MDKLLIVQDAAQTLGMDRVAGASVMHKLCVPIGVTSAVMLKQPPHSPPGGPTPDHREVYTDQHSKHNLQ